MKKNILWTLPALTLAAGAMTLTACGNDANVSQSTGSLVASVYTITFNPLTGNENIVTVSAKAGEDVAFPANPSRSGYQFLGWSTKYAKAKKNGDGAAIVTALKASANQTLYAVWGAASSHTEAEIDAYMAGLKEKSQANHLYYHYYKFDLSEANYADWDVWAWAYKPTSGEGAKFDWAKDASGKMLLDDFGGAYVDIDLGATYDGGWDAATKTMGGTEVTFRGAEQVGLQIVQTSTRSSGSGFWVNDGSNLFPVLSDYAMALDQGEAYHIFVMQDNVQNPSKRPLADTSDPFADDDGTNTTYGNDAYATVDWSKTADKVGTSEDFKSLGVGYQIMVSSFADSDNDGSGDIYGIYKKLDYLEGLGVKALWLTPIQLSDSYHGYDITDYEQVDPKFGSSESDAAKANGGKVTSATALADYKQLIEAAHAKGMKIVMDLVLNHTSTSNNWFVSSANLDPDYRGYYQWGNHKTQSHIKEDNYWYPYGTHDYSYYAKFGTSMPELNFSYKSTREAVEDMSVYWVKDVGVDGFRLDAVKHIFMKDEVASTAGDTVINDASTAGDYSSDLTKNLHFFRELKKSVADRSGKNVFFVGENFDGHAYHVAPYYEAFDSLFDFYSYFNLTSAAATGHYGTTSRNGTASGFLNNTSLYTIAADTSSTSGVIDGGGVMRTADNSKWNFIDAYGTYNRYRGDESLPGLFTSNHDIARVINRIAGNGTAEGINVQGNITPQNWAEWERSANCVKIAELLMPGLTWIYYGDELGMTGNFPADELRKIQEQAAIDPSKVKLFDYADLWYRQPMKWGDDYTTDYHVTGAGEVGWDEVNASSAVAPASTQVTDPNSEYNILAKFAKLKSSAEYGKLLSVGTMEAKYYGSGANPNMANVLSFDRVYNGVTLRVAINFNSGAIATQNFGGTVLASYNGATTSNLPAFSAIVVKA